MGRPFLYQTGSVAVWAHRPTPGSPRVRRAILAVLLPVVQHVRERVAALAGRADRDGVIAIREHLPARAAEGRARVGFVYRRLGG